MGRADLQFAIIAGGRAERLADRVAVDEKPKLLLSLYNQTILSRMIDDLQKGGFTPQVSIYAQEKDMPIQQALTNYITTDLPGVRASVKPIVTSSTADALRHIISRPESPRAGVLVTYGDIVLPRAALGKFAQVARLSDLHADVLVGVLESKEPGELSEAKVVYESAGYRRVTRLVKNKTLEEAVKPDGSEEARLFACVFFLSPRAVEQLGVFRHFSG